MVMVKCGSAVKMISTSVTSFRNYVRRTYGTQTQELTAKYGKCLEKLAHFNNHVVFNARCKKQDVVPPSLQIRSPVDTQRGWEIAKRASRSFLNERLRLANHRKRELMDELKWREIGLRRALNTVDYE